MGFQDSFITIRGQPTLVDDGSNIFYTLHRTREPAIPRNPQELYHFIFDKANPQNQRGNKEERRAIAMPYLLHPALATCPSRRHIPSPLTTTTMNPSRTHNLVSLISSGNRLGKSIVGTTTTTIRCMANPRRVKMVAKQIRRELSDMLLTDKVLQYAVLPEASLGADRYLSSLTTISEVEVSADLQVVKVYVSVFGDERGKEVAIAGLKSKAKYVRSELGRRMKLRLTPEIRFIEDESIERGSRVIAILDKIKNEKKGAESREQSDSSAVHEEDNEWGDEDPDQGIIYVE